jgi:hypothetical protein
MPPNQKTNVKRMATTVTKYDKQRSTETKKEEEEWGLMLFEK